MSFHTKTLGTITNTEGKRTELSIPAAILILAGAGVGAYVGLNIGGPMGAAVGALVGSFVGALAVGYIKSLKVIVHPSGAVEVNYETRFG